MLAKAIRHIHGIAGSFIRLRAMRCYDTPCAVCHSRLQERFSFFRQEFIAPLFASPRVRMSFLKDFLVFALAWPVRLFFCQYKSGLVEKGSDVVFFCCVHQWLFRRSIQMSFPTNPSHYAKESERR